MSKQIEAALADSTDDSEAEEYFATNREHSHIAPRHSSSRKRGAASTKEQEETELPVKLHEEDEEMGHHSPDRNLVNIGWAGNEEKENLNTPISAYLNAFFMTIATVLVRNEVLKPHFLNLSLCVSLFRSLETHESFETMIILMG